MKFLEFQVPNKIEEFGVMYHLEIIHFFSRSITTKHLLCVKH